ncbi:sortase domain-bontaining protein [Paenarthrobacter sp. NPDC056912]|uniref:sortase domain-containing protein n=1 Tax=Paenarthrobacter sp. NPDC056912 TaxID=3345965 RepID=UPI00366C5E7A
MTTTKTDYRRGLLVSAVVGFLLLTGCAPSQTESANAPGAEATSAPAPSTAPATPPASLSPPTVQAVPGEPLPAVMTTSRPATLAIPAIGVRTELLELGLRDNGSLEVPQDTGDGAPAGWYKGSPTPGERGPSVMLGHVNALGGHAGVFADLQKLRADDEITVTRADGSTAAFTVYRSALYSKESFPTVEVYGNTEGSELRLITCDGYDPATGLFDDNYVIFAKLSI